MPKLENFNEEAKKHNSGGGGWWRPTEPTSKIRIVSDEFAVLPKHFISKEDGSVVCVGIDKGCDVVEVDETSGEEKHSRPSIKYLFWILDRVDSEIKIAEMPYTVSKAISALKNDNEYGFDVIPSYDMTINRESTGPKQWDIEYSVLPSRNDTPLTEQEQDEINTTIKPLEEIVDRMKEKRLAELAESENPPVNTAEID